MKNRIWLIPLALFIVVLAHGSLIGLTDDEAYYWVLAQKPALGYAYHPPAVALAIALSQKLLGWVAGDASAFVVRLPAAACAAAIVALGMHWMRRAGGKALGLGALALISVGGIFGLSWMMVPDLPLFLGWTLAFAATWEICFAGTGEYESARTFPENSYALLVAGTALSILSKYSAVLGSLSAAIALLCWAPRDRRWRGLLALVLGGVVAAIPILWWNATHQWASILYQVRERHGSGQLSLSRYLRFWAVELVLAGPPLLLFAVASVRRWIGRSAPRPIAYALLWAAPGAAVFCLQPLWADFKPHWTLIVWWPVALGLGWTWSTRSQARWGLARAQVAFGLALSALVMLSCHLPLGGWVLSRLGRGAVDPRLDVTNDLYGWPEVRSFLSSAAGPGASQVPIVASRYQTAAQAAFAMGSQGQVTLLPRDLKAMDEWPSLSVSDGEGPEWPRLKRPVIFVGDNRYDSGPEYVGANCRKAWTLEKKRFGLEAKTIYFWWCEPESEKLISK